MLLKERGPAGVMQLYLRDDDATFTQPVRALRGFERVTLPPGATRDVQFTLDQDDFALLDEKLQRIVEPGTFTVFVGGSSEATDQLSFEVTTGAALPGLGSRQVAQQRGDRVLHLERMSHPVVRVSTLARDTEQQACGHEQEQKTQRCRRCEREGQTR